MSFFITNYTCANCNLPIQTWQHSESYETTYHRIINGCRCISPKILIKDVKND